MPSYFFWISQANRWCNCVDFNSPMSAWTTNMLNAYSQANGDKTLAATILKSNN